MSSHQDSLFLLPFPTRKAGITEKLDFAETQRNQLGQALMDSYKAAGDKPKFISLIAESILSNARECFDHLGKDLIEGHLLNVAKKSFVDTYKSGKTKSYFPFYSPQIKNPNLPFFQFKAVNRAIFDELVAFVTAIDRKNYLGNTLHQVENFRIICGMVNEKKHSRVLEYKVADYDKVFIEGKDGSFLFDKSFRNDHPNMQVVLPDRFVPRSVGSYRFACNGRDVAELCLFAVHATAMVMDNFYDKFFASTEKVFKPEPPPIITVTPAPLSEVLMQDPDKYIIRLP